MSFLTNDKVYTLCLFIIEIIDIDITDYTTLHNNIECQLMSYSKLFKVLFFFNIRKYKNVRGRLDTDISNVFSKNHCRKIL